MLKQFLGSCLINQLLYKIIVKLAKNHSKIDISPPLSVGMAAIHTTSSLDKEILQKSSFEELGYSSGHKYFTML